MAAIVFMVNIDLKVKHFYYKYTERGTKQRHQTLKATRLAVVVIIGKQC